MRVFLIQNLLVLLQAACRVGRRVKAEVPYAQGAEGADAIAPR